MIKIEHLEKSYGQNKALRSVSFSAHAGEMLGFVGPNGAGKSTTIRILLGFLFASGGQASIGGLDCAKEGRRIKQMTGYVPSDVRLYPDMRVGELLRRNAAFYANTDLDEMRRLCELFELDETKRFRELSTGNKKKVVLVCALSTNMRVLILDEPTSGLDPMVQKALFAELKRQTERGVCVLLSSHNLAEVGEHCDRVAFIRDGAIIAQTNLQGKQHTAQKIVTITGGGKLPAQMTLLRTNGDERVLSTPLDGEALLSHLSQIGPSSFLVRNESMEERFMSLYEKEARK